MIRTQLHYQDYYFAISYRIEKLDKYEGLTTAVIGMI